MYTTTNQGGRESIEVFEVDTRGADSIGGIPFPDDVISATVSLFK